MSDFKTLTLQLLRDLARKHLGEGYAKLKTKNDLIAALTKAAPESLKAAAAKVAATATQAPPGAPTEPETAKGTPAAQKAKAAKKPKAEEPAPVVKFPRRPKVVEPAAESTVQGAGAAASNGAAPAAGEPVVEGFFVARMAGEGEARRHRLTEEQARPMPLRREDTEGLGELPAAYEDDALVLLPRDVRTLFAFWDFHPRTRDAAAEGLDHPRAVLRLFDGDTLMREVDFALESKSYYLHEVPSGRRYRVEAHFVGADGRSKRIGRSSNSILLPNDGVSSDTSVRFLKVPWDVPLQRLRDVVKERQLATERAGDHRYLTWRRFKLPHSAEGLMTEDEAQQLTGILGPATAHGGWIPSRSGSGRPY